LAKIKDVTKRNKSKAHLLHPFVSDDEVEAGVDEVGRGCGAGPVVAAAVILPPVVDLPDVRDSKKLSAEKRNSMSLLIQEVALDFAIGVATVEEIDEINILEATYLAMNRAIQGLKKKPTLLIIDGNRYKNTSNIRYQTVIGGDDKVLSIAAASILAKTWRDDYMAQLHDQHPQYDWKNNKGYLTAKHRNACFLHGLTKHHRHTFGGMRPAGE